MGGYSHSYPRVQSGGSVQKGVSHTHTHTRAWTHTHIHTGAGWLSAVPEGTQWTKWGSERCFWLPVEPLSSGLRAPAPPGPQGRVEGRKGGVTHEVGMGVRRKRGVRVVPASRKY